MAEQISETDPELRLLDAQDDFSSHAIELAGKSRRDLMILSHRLDPLVYDTEDFYQAVLRFARQDRRSMVRMLVNDVKPIVEQGHYLLRLARRLSSKVEIRRLAFEPKDKEAAWLMGDRQYLLYKHDDSVYRGFVNYNARMECLEFADEFNILWDRHSVVDPSLRTFLL